MKKKNNFKKKLNSKEKETFGSLNEFSVLSNAILKLDWLEKKKTETIFSVFLAS